MFSGRLVLTRRLLFSLRRGAAVSFSCITMGLVGFRKGRSFPEGTHAKTKTHPSDVAFTIFIDVTVLSKDFL